MRVRSPAASARRSRWCRPPRRIPLRGPQHHHRPGNLQLLSAPRPRPETLPGRWSSTRTRSEAHWSPWWSGCRATVVVGSVVDEQLAISKRDARRQPDVHELRSAGGPHVCLFFHRAPSGRCSRPAPGVASIASAGVDPPAVVADASGDVRRRRRVVRHGRVVGRRRNVRRNCVGDVRAATHRHPSATAHAHIGVCDPGAVNSDDRPGDGREGEDARRRDGPGPCPMSHFVYLLTGD